MVNLVSGILLKLIVCALVCVVNLYTGCESILFVLCAVKTDKVCTLNMYKVEENWASNGMLLAYISFHTDLDQDRVHCDSFIRQSSLRQSSSRIRTPVCTSIHHLSSVLLD
jgi:hypothetical protein